MHIYRQNIPFCDSFGWRKGMKVLFRANFIYEKIQKALIAPKVYEKCVMVDTWKRSATQPFYWQNDCLALTWIFAQSGYIQFDFSRYVTISVFLDFSNFSRVSQKKSKGQKCNFDELATTKPNYIMLKAALILITWRKMPKLNRVKSQKENVMSDT